MNKKVINRLLLIVKICLIISGITFICLSIFTEEKNNNYLIISLVSTMLANIMNILGGKQKKF